uniref:PARP catalytic domain-containing protein n=1 Tax=Myripristis murdjan TaxID=586833 RepID=A0A667Z8L2_9TELE
MLKTGDQKCPRINRLSSHRHWQPSFRKRGGCQSHDIRSGRFHPQLQREDGRLLCHPSNTLTEEAREAKHWLNDVFSLSGTFIASNNFIQYFGEQEFRQLSRKLKRGVSIEEFLEKESAGVKIQGMSVEDVAVVRVQVEAMLCRIQKDFVEEEKSAMPKMSITSGRKPVDRYTHEFKYRESVFRSSKLSVIRVDKVENSALKDLFELKKKQLGPPGSPRTMYQRIPAQFCEMVSQVGIHREYTPPDDPRYGKGIYFTGSVQSAMDVWRDMVEEYLYFVEAQVLTGKSTPGKPEFIVPPAVGEDPAILYDSLSGGSDISVIFSGHQALPTYIIICKKMAISRIFRWWQEFCKGGFVICKWRKYVT